MKIVIFFQLFAFIIVANAFKSDNLSSLEEKIVSGKEVTSMYFKCIVALKEDDKHFGTAAFISEKHLVTAAECLRGFFTCENPDFKKFYAWVDSYDLFYEGKKYHFEQVEIHEGYDFETRFPAANIGVITLLKWDTDRLYIVSLGLTENYLGDRVYGQVAGWGPAHSLVKENNSKFENSLLSLSIDVKSMKGGNCKEAVDDQFSVDERIFCAYNHSNAINFPLEERDIGTPFIHKMKTALGVLSYLSHRKSTLQAAIFTNINKYHTWITAAMKDLSKRNNTTESKIARFDDSVSNLDLNFDWMSGCYRV